MGVLAALLAPLTRRDVYPAQGTRLPAEQTDLELRAGDGVALRGWVVNPGQQCALVYFGGNAESIQDQRAELARHLPGHTAYLVSYRGYGASEGRPSQRALTEDALQMLDHAAARHSAAGVDVIGRSLGSGVAVQAAVRRPVRRLVLVTPFDSAAGVARDHLPWFPAQRLLADTWDSASAAARLSSPVLVVRAGRDDVVRPPLTDRLVAALPQDVEVLDLPARDHGDVVADPAYWPSISAFLG